MTRFTAKQKDYKKINGLFPNLSEGTHFVLHCHDFLKNERLDKPRLYLVFSETLDNH